MGGILRVAELAGTDFVGSRHSGEKIRHRIKEAIDKGHKVVLDFNGVSGITQGFADEAIGILIRAFGIDTVVRHVSVVNANKKVKLVLNWVANYSKRIHARNNTGI